MRFIVSGLPSGRVRSVDFKGPKRYGPPVSSRDSLNRRPHYALNPGRDTNLNGYVRLKRARVIIICCCQPPLVGSKQFDSTRRRYRRVITVNS